MVGDHIKCKISFEQHKAFSCKKRARKYRSYFPWSKYLPPLEKTKKQIFLFDLSSCHF